MSTPIPKPLTWLITGCSSGFGLSLTRLLLSTPHTVIATSRNPSKTPDLVRLVTAANPSNKWLTLDVTSPASPAFIHNLEAAGVHIDVLVNNAGYSIFAPMETVRDAEIRAQMETVFFGPLRLLQAVLPGMRARKRGTVVNFSSGAALEGQPTMGVYAGAKAGLDGVAKVLAKEVAPFNIRILTVVLGTFNTNMGNAAVFGEGGLPGDYEGTMTEKFLQIMKSGTWPPNGDKEKAMKAVYEVVVGEGIGEGREAEKLLLLGSDMMKRTEGVREQLGHALEVFGEVAKGCDIEK
ncbi:NAD(P)-binding protein [Mytilinidion resinicola]|uniref:NAD(P)-binding protein n=1 Tax=Mytilinidion resinicola TaxID=574789 RepID=A0A6A6YUA0_9PEZI|nr:NAD(P)-binding protein [Mytilinidion resinicola]KAF2812099.1 NAD(P)-binding protein [Mytilinidion resinicola]